MAKLLKMIKGGAFSPSFLSLSIYMKVTRKKWCDWRDRYTERGDKCDCSSVTGHGYVPVHVCVCVHVEAGSLC